MHVLFFCNESNKSAYLKFSKPTSGQSYYEIRIDNSLFILDIFGGKMRNWNFLNKQLIPRNRHNVE